MADDSVPQDDVTPLFAKLIERFERRARARQREAYAILVVMALLIGLAGWVFIQAKEITDRETDTSLHLTQAQVKNKQENDQAKLNALVSQLNDTVNKALNSISDETPNHRDTIRILAVDLVKNGTILKSPKDLLDEIHGNLLNSGTKDVVVDFHLKYDSKDRIWSRQIDLSQAQNVAPDLSAGSADLSSILSDITHAEDVIKVDKAAVDKLQSQSMEAKVSKIIGKEPNGDKAAGLSLPFLLQLNITRFGTLSLVGITIGILVPLYRYSSRLAAFYTARADAIRLQQLLAYKQTGFVRLSAALTPQFDFGKTQTSADHLIDAVRLLQREGKEGG